jgi:hypothetical protein
MKIKPDNHPEIDTDKLPDLEAQIVEKEHEFTDFLKQNKVPFLVIVETPSMKTFQVVSNFASAQRETGESALALFKVLDKWVGWATDGQMKIVREKD